jgi:hypothetical protein
MKPHRDAEKKSGHTNAKTGASGNSGGGFAARSAFCIATQEIQSPNFLRECETICAEQNPEKILMRYMTKKLRQNSARCSCTSLKIRTPVTKINEIMG